MYNHHKRMLPRREDGFRTEFPANYYSTSSVYSYSPTSTSDCPEHGRSRRRTTVILVTSVIIATLGVLSIAGIAAYLGIISKNISNNASQYEESFLQANTRISKTDSAEENDSIYQHGRSNDESGFIDITNSLSDTKTGLGPPGDDDLTNNHRRESDNAIKHRHIVTRPPDIVFGSNKKLNLTSKEKGPDHINISAKPVTVVVKSTSTSSSSSVSNKDNNAYNHYNPIDMIPPPTRVPGENSVSYFTEEPTSTKTTVRSPSRHDRNRNRNPTSTEASTTTRLHPHHKDQTSTTETSSEGPTKTTPQTLPTEEQRFRSTIKRPSSSSTNMQLPGMIRESIVHVTPFDAKPTIPHPTAYYENEFSKRLGMADEQVTSSQHENHKSHDSSNIARGEEDSTVPSTSGGVHQDQFRPLHQYPNRDLLLNNHKMPISFDRVSPEVYDENPWTPLLDRPNMDKRPRVEIHKRPLNSDHTEATVHHFTTADIGRYGMGSRPGPDHIHTETSVKLHTPNANGKPTSKLDDNRPISHGMNTTSPSLGTTPQKRPEKDDVPAYVEETMGGFRPVSIPAYTVLIPHIPNSPSNEPKNTTKKIINAPVTEEHEEVEEEEEEEEEEEPEGEDRNLHTSLKFDRVGLVEVVDSAEHEQIMNGHQKPMRHDTDDNEQVQVTKNEPEEDYGDNEELTDDNGPSPTKIYKLDPDNVDIVPDTLGTVNRDKAHSIETQDLKKDGNNNNNNANSSTFHTQLHSSSTMDETTPREPDPLVRSTTELILSTLGSLNLIKSTSTPKQGKDDLESTLRASDIPSEESEEDEDDTLAKEAIPSKTNGSGESPLFPPVRSYVGVNLPLRPKPTTAFGPESSNSTDSLKRLRMQPFLQPDFTTASSLQKVLSMMMRFEEEPGVEEGRGIKSNVPIVNVTKQNVNLLLADGTRALGSKKDEAKHVTTPYPSPIMTSTRREQKSYNNRQSKIDEQFANPEHVEHVPVPLIMEMEMKSTTTTKPKIKLTNVTVNEQNSPVYKFVLRQGQNVEDLLKEIFNNFTEAESSQDMMADAPQIPETFGSTHYSHSQRPLSFYPSGPMPSLKSLDDGSSKTDQTTTNSVTFSNLKLGEMHGVRPTIQSAPPVVQTATSIVINDGETSIECPKNSSFRCVSTRKCIPSYLRCNFIKECPDNSDEENCTCADFLKANGNGRKLCDGVVDCADASDEYAYCEYCKPGQYICAGSRSCINKTQICDSSRDCPFGDDENDCVRIGHTTQTTDAEEFSSQYNKNGQLMVRKKGAWGKLCVETFNSVVSHWEVKDLAKAVCKALTFSDYESVERVSDESTNSTDPYYELFYGISTNDTEDIASAESSSSESTPRVGLGFKKTECKSRQVINVTCQDLQCGTAPKSFTQTARIVGGANSMPGKWPWQAALYKNGEYQCGATLISSRWLLSAGHCFYNAQDDYWVARLGTLRRGATVLSPYEQVVRITHIFLHPQYQNVGFVNDVSLLRLEQEVNFTDYVRPVCLPSKDTQIRDGRMCTVVGWGQLFEVGRVFPDTLQEVQLPLISTAECRKRTLFLPLYKLTDQMFCAGYDRGGRDACLGDSGGPMMCQENDGRWSLYGVTSNGYGCARANRPGVYTKVASYLDWIYEKMNLDDSIVFREKPKYCSGHRCLLGECLLKSQVCNGILDCIEDNGSDERGLNCTTHFGIT